MPFWLHFILGYLLSVVVATFVTLSGFIFTHLFGSNLDPFFDLGAAYIVGFIITFVAAFPGFSIAIYFASFELDTTYCYWVVSGFVNVILALVLFFTLAGKLFLVGFIPFALLGGAAGGYAYASFRDSFPYL